MKMRTTHDGGVRIDLVGLRPKGCPNCRISEADLDSLFEMSQPLTFHDSISFSSWFEAELVDRQTTDTPCFHVSRAQGSTRSPGGEDRERGATGVKWSEICDPTGTWIVALNCLNSLGCSPQTQFIAFIASINQHFQGVIVILCLSLHLDFICVALGCQIFASKVADKAKKKCPLYVSCSSPAAKLLDTSEFWEEGWLLCDLSQ